LDHFPSRQDAAYWGPVNGGGGREPCWPNSDGRRIFAYLKRSASLPEVVGCLRDSGEPTIVYVSDLEAETRHRFECPTLRFESNPVDLARAAKDCDLAILNAGHGATAEMLLAGKPVLELPIVLEQSLVARAVESLGAGETVTVKNISTFGEKFHAMLTDDRYRVAAQAFSTRHADFDVTAQRQQMLGRALELVQPAPARRPVFCSRAVPELAAS
jgi:UDP:flavonoid glycosyltransferase YjiC (YdhE family)